MVLIVGFIISIILFYIYINGFSFLKQTERSEGLWSHKRKNGTMTMGGNVIFLVANSLFLLFNNTYSLKVLLLLLPPIFFYIIGFIDDFLIVKYHKNDGLNGNLRILFEILFSGIYYILYLLIFKRSSLNLFGYNINLGFLYGIFIMLILTGSANSCNLTDGIDGLMGGIYVICLIFFLIICASKRDTEIGLYIMTNIAASCGFLYYNLPRAKIFMGDCGSLYMGASLASLALIFNMEMYLPLILIIPVIETLSVIMQVLYFKFTKGKRLFKMAPLHHHLEIKGYSEIKIISIFYIITIIATFISLFIYFKM